MSLSTEEMTMITLDAFNYHIDEYNRKILLPVILANTTLDELKEDNYVDSEYFDEVNEDDIFHDSLYHSVLDFRDLLPTDKIKYWDAETRNDHDRADDLASMARYSTRDALRDYMQDRFTNEIIKAK